jgi:hypothetical protein
MKDNKPFFVGYLPVPPGLRGFLWAVMTGFIVAAAGLGFAIGATQDDPGTGSFRFDYGRQTVTGVIEMTPTAVLHVTEGNERIPAGHTLMLSGQGKNGAAPRARPLDGQLATASGILLERGDLDMLQLRGGRDGLSAADGTAPSLPAWQPLGRWRLTGEICDGKCLAGAMRPGRGLSHKACANLCIAGGIPPVFVSTQAVEGEEFLMIAGVGDDTLPPELYDWVALYVTLEGEITRHGDLLVLAIDPATVELAR